MKRRHLNNLTTIITILAILALIYLAAYIFQNKLYQAFSITLLSLPILILFVLLPIGRTRLQSEGIFSQRRYVLPRILLVQLLSFIFFFSSMSFFTHTLMLSQSPETVLHHTRTFYHTLFAGFGLFPWGMAILFALSIDTLSKKKGSTLGSPLDTKANSLGLTMAINGVYNTLRLGFLTILSSFIIFFAMELCNLLYGPFSLSHNSVIGGAVSIVLLIIFTQQRFTRLIEQLKKRHHGLFLYMLVLIAISLAVCLVLNFVFILFHKHIDITGKHLTLHAWWLHLNSFSIFEFYAIAWWLLLSPLLGSLLWQLSTSLSYRRLISYSLPLPIIVQFTSPYWLNAINFSAEHTLITCFAIQAALIIGILYFSSRPCFNQTLWLGYLNQRNIKPRHRLEILALLIPILLVCVSLHANVFSVLLFAGISFTVLLSEIMLLFRMK
ncbi:MAG: hypothetical protein COV52_08630 [Gammaproteobacteria bacterium CG11_big_fil_rev_8_21_14_0_20_46_22]|nr:MAG: hypothetical protein COW05_01100 [Gammaproteobacteria bacterium CG12_big_fil_rev_8_21_14_0_65_46_12]PIR10558.1 MAG: hypothetical protein COV52_08630 [Gammaproteobacteria bacterium CG11_big_fil_rev_8_21_14_0_20_46_22]